MGPRAAELRLLPRSPEPPPARAVPVQPEWILLPREPPLPESQEVSLRRPALWTIEDALRPQELPSREALPPPDQLAVLRQWPALPGARLQGRDEAARQTRPAPGAAAEQSFLGRASALPPEEPRLRAPPRVPPSQAQQASRARAPRKTELRQPLASPLPGAPCGRALPAPGVPAAVLRYRPVCAPATSRSSASLPAPLCQPRCCRRVRAGYARAHVRLRPLRSNSSGFFSPSRQPGPEHPEFPCS